VIAAVSVAELRQAGSAFCSQLVNEDVDGDESQHCDDEEASIPCPSELDSDSSDLSLPQRKVTLDHQDSSTLVHTFPVNTRKCSIVISLQLLPCVWKSHEL